MKKKFNEVICFPIRKKSQGYIEEQMKIYESFKNDKRIKLMVLWEEKELCGAILVLLAEIDGDPRITKDMVMNLDEYRQCFLDDCFGVLHAKELSERNLR